MDVCCLWLNTGVSVRACVCGVCVRAVDPKRGYDGDIAGRPKCFVHSAFLPPVHTCRNSDGKEPRVGSYGLPGDMEHWTMPLLHQHGVRLTSVFGMVLGSPLKYPALASLLAAWLSTRQTDDIVVSLPGVTLSECDDIPAPPVNLCALGLEVAPGMLRTSLRHAWLALKGHWRADLDTAARCALVWLLLRAWEEKASELVSLFQGIGSECMGLDARILLSEEELGRVARVGMHLVDTGSIAVWTHLLVTLVQRGNATRDFVAFPAGAPVRAEHAPPSVTFGDRASERLWGEPLRMPIPLVVPSVASMYLAVYELPYTATRS